MESAAAAMKAPVCRQLKVRPLPCDGRRGRSGGAAVASWCAGGRTERQRVSAAMSRPVSSGGSDLSSPAPSPLRVAYQGVPGAYSEAAAGKAYPGCSLIPSDTFEAAEQGVADRAVLPIENSLGGSIHRNFDLLLRHRLHIVGEVQLPVRHCLLALPGVRMESLTRVISHPQALAQCEETLTRMGGLDAARVAVDDTAGAAASVAADGLRDTAAIASSRAADRPFKTSIVFADDSEGGASVLFKVLAAFALRDISPTKIESRPNHTCNRRRRLVDDHNVARQFDFRYVFYVDFQASLADPRTHKALDHVREFTSFLRVLGTYPMDETAAIPSS